MFTVSDLHFRESGFLHFTLSNGVTEWSYAIPETDSGTLGAIHLVSGHKNKVNMQHLRAELHKQIMSWEAKTSPLYIDI